MRERIKVTATQLRADRAGLAAGWLALVDHVRQEQSDLVLLPEMPFYPWLFAEQPYNQQAWDAAVAAHNSWLLRLAELAPAVVASSRPVTLDGHRLNEAFIWEVDGGYQAIHYKRYLPDEPGFWEASWYERSDDDFNPVTVSLQDGTSVKLGFLICTELWFMEHARAYGQAGVHLLLNPRATERRTRSRWLVGGKAAAIIGGAYTLSANQVASTGELEALGGQGWVVDPAGEALALTADGDPFRTVTVDLAAAEAAKESYPRYVVS